jgi:hypothetical protein
MIEIIKVFSFEEWIKILSSGVNKKILYSFEGSLTLREPGKIYHTFRVKSNNGKLKYEFHQNGLDSEGRVSREEFLEFLEKYHPDCMEWILFHPEWLQ